MLSILLLECIEQLREQLVVVGAVNRDCSSQCRRLAVFVFAWQSSGCFEFHVLLMHP